jgi:hypothetical protein
MKLLAVLAVVLVATVALACEDEELRLITRSPTATATATPEPTPTPELTPTPERTPTPTPTLMSAATPSPAVTAPPPARPEVVATPASFLDVRWELRDLGEAVAHYAAAQILGLRRQAHLLHSSSWRQRCPFENYDTGQLAFTFFDIYDVSDAELVIQTIDLEGDRAYVEATLRPLGQEGPPVNLFTKRTFKYPGFWILEGGFWKLDSEDPDPCR